LELPMHFHRRFSRLILLLLLFILSFFMSAIYKSTLFSFLSSPPKYIFLSSSNDLEASGRHWATLDNSVLTKAFQNRPVLDSRLIAISMGEFTEYAFRMLEEPGKYVLVQTVSPIFSLTWIGKSSNIQRMEQLRVFFHRFEIIKWNLQYFARNEEQNRRKVLKEPRLESLQVDQLAGAYAILLIGMFLGTLVLIFEDHQSFITFTTPEPSQLVLELSYRAHKLREFTSVARLSS
ncbi:unnamed protein product, partial [Cyprideis torosa]